MNTSPDVFIFDDMTPEDSAMSQALYSRSPASILDHRQKVEEVGSGKFMGTFYKGYGHASIGDCGSTTVHTENVSMLVAKGVQDNRLYNGQEASTRYLDFSNRPIIDPYNHSVSTAIQKRWIAMYAKYKPLMIAGLKRLHPHDPESGDTEAKWAKAIEVRAFDTLRSLIPLGCTTFLSWHTNIRQLRDHTRRMNFHPAAEVSGVGAKIYSEAVEKYPNSFNGDELDLACERYQERNAYAQRHAMADHYLTPEEFMADIRASCHDDLYAGKIVTTHNFDVRALVRDPMLRDRPQGAPLPRRLMKYGTFTFNYLLDFGSFRDVQRHRDGYCPIPLVTNYFGFYSGYDEEFRRVLNEEDYVLLSSEIEKQLFDIEFLSENNINTNPVSDQYLYPMGMAVGVSTNYSLPQSVYVAELRSGETVHFTLRPVAQKIADEIGNLCPDLNLYINRTPDVFSVKRGGQDIVAKA